MEEAPIQPQVPPTDPSEARRQKQAENSFNPYPSEPKNSEEEFHPYDTQDFQAKKQADVAQTAEDTEAFIRKNEETKNDKDSFEDIHKLHSG